MKKLNKNRIIVILIVLVALDILVFWQIGVLNATNQDLRIYFLDVGQGDSELVILPGGVKILIDGGLPNGKVLSELAKILPPTDRYIDLVVLSHPQLDHFGGLIEVLKRYRVGAFIHNGRSGTAKAFLDLEKVLQENNIRVVTLSGGEKIRYQKSVFNILSPISKLLFTKELNDTTLVMELDSKNIKTLFTGDISQKIERRLLNGFITEIDVLKVAHHGSKYSSSANFLSAINPALAIIEVGRNSYGHPTQETLNRLNRIGVKVYRTDEDGTIELVADGESLKVFK